jgi:hypothetical protein
MLTPLSKLNNTTAFAFSYFITKMTILTLALFVIINTFPVRVYLGRVYSFWSLAIFVLLYLSIPTIALTIKSNLIQTFIILINHAVLSLIVFDYFDWVGVLLLNSFIIGFALLSNYVYSIENKYQVSQPAKISNILIATPATLVGVIGLNIIRLMTP